MEYTKFKHKLQEYNCILGIDLATYVTGVSLYDLQSNTFAILEEIAVPKDCNCKTFNLYNQLTQLFNRIREIANGPVLVIKEALPIQNGPHSTINTLQSLAGSHAVLDIVVAQNNDLFHYYDDKGIYTISVKALFKSERVPKPDKKDVRQGVVDYFHLDDSLLTDNISDSIGVIYTLLQRKWNNDLQEEIKSVRKAMKSLKREYTKTIHQQHIDFLESLKVVK